jgi:hypothetical protein
MSGRRYFGSRAVFHDAVHDIESFFWVLVHICLTRKGPGGVLREELEEENDDDEQGILIRRLFYCFFDSDNETMQTNKAHIFANPDDLETFVLDNFHPYFHELKGLVKEWFHTLRLAHQFHAFEYYNIHDMVLEILEKALNSLPSDVIDEAGQSVLKTRKEDIEELNSFGKQQMLLPHVSPQSQLRRMSPPSSPTLVPPSKRRRTMPDINE